MENKVMRIKQFFVLLSIILVPLFSGTSLVTGDEYETNTPEVCIEGEDKSADCITVCCYVIYNRTTTPTGQYCESGGTTHCSDCCMVNCPPGETQ